MDLDEVRRTLQQERKRRRIGRDTLSERTGVAPSTIQEIETGSGSFELRTLLRLIEGIPGLTVSEFFAIAEGSVTPPVTDELHTLPSPTGGAHAEPVPIVSAADPDALRLLQRLAIALLHLIDPPDIPPKT